MTTTKTHPMKTATAKRVAGNLYQITYSDSVMCDGPVPYDYLRSLARNGYRVEVKDYEGDHIVAAS